MPALEAATHTAPLDSAVPFTQIKAGVRQAAPAYADGPVPPQDEFLGWFLDVHQPKAARRNGRRNLEVPIEPTPLNLPDRKTLAAAVETWTAAEPRLAAWLSSGLKPTQALARWATLLLRLNQVQKALEVFLAIAALEPDDPLHWSNLGVALDRAGALPEAAATLEKSLCLSRQQPDTWLQLGLVRGKQRLFDRAESAYRAALEVDAASALAWQCLGLLKEEQGDAAGAIDCYTASVVRGSHDAALFANRARLCYRIGRFVDAHESYRLALVEDPHFAQALSMEPKLRFLRRVLEGDAPMSVLNDLAQEGVLADVASQIALAELGHCVLSGFGHSAEALAIARASLERWPAQPSLAYLMAAVEGTGAPDRSPPEYIVEHFDRFADKFDAQLVGALGYDIPEKLCALVRPLFRGSPASEVLDAGCGTGLCGPHLRPFATTLHGVDLSPRMLEHARNRGNYDHLACEELLSYLVRSPRRFDAIVAADLVIYFGELSTFFSNAAYSLKSGGILAISTESCPGATFQLLSSGRFAHPASYVEASARPEFELVARTSTTFRLEGTERVAGTLFVFRKF